jgi:hypothetical protein
MDNDQPVKFKLPEGFALPTSTRPQTCWQKAGPILEEIRQWELRNLTDAQRRKAVDSVMRLAAPRRCLKPTSGLIAWHALLKRKFG